MPDILRILPTGGTYKEFKSDIPSGNTVVIGAIVLVQDTYGVALTADEEATQRAAAAAFAAGSPFGGGGVVGTAFNEAGTEIVYVYEAEKIMLPKEIATGEAFLVGDDVFLDPVGLLVHPVRASGFLWVGTCQTEADEDDARVLCSFEGNVISNN